MILTIFTPTYNRAYTLSALYDSLCRQSCKDFEWLIVDDGSTDATEELIQSYIAEGKLDIRYIKQPNGGKHRAINRGVVEACGELFFIVDSDDYLLDHAVELILKEWNNLPHRNFSGVCGRRIFFNGEKVGGEWGNYRLLDCSSREFRYKFHAKGDMAEVFRTDILKMFPFPEFKGERFVPEALIWDQVTQYLPMRFFNVGIYCCEYLDDGYSKNFKKNLRANSKGFMTYYKSLVFGNPFAYQNRIIPMSTKIKAILRIFQCTIYRIIH